MALSVHREGERNDKFKLEYTKSGGTGHHYQQSYKHNTGSNTFLPASNYGNMGINEVITSTPRVSSRTMGGGAYPQRNTQVNGTGDGYSNMPPFCLPYDSKSTGESSSNTNQDSFYSPWSLDTTADDDLGLPQMPPTPNGIDFDCQGQGLDQSLTSDRFGLNSSTSSGGFALDDLVSKILEDDQSLFAYNGMPDASADSSNPYSELFSFNGSSNMGTSENPDNWSSMADTLLPPRADCPTSIPSHNRMERNPSGSSSLGYGSMPRPSPASDLLWDLGAGGDSSSNNLVNEQLFMDNLYGMTARSDHMMNDSDTSLNHSDLALRHSRSNRSDHRINDASDNSLSHADLALRSQNSPPSKSRFTYTQQLFPEQQFPCHDLHPQNSSQTVSTNSFSNYSHQQMLSSQQQHHGQQQQQPQHQQNQQLHQQQQQQHHQQPQQQTSQQYHSSVNSLSENHGFNNMSTYSSHPAFSREMACPPTSLSALSASAHPYKPHSSSNPVQYPDVSMSFTSPSSAYKVSTNKASSSSQPLSCNGMQDTSGAPTLETWSNPELQQAVNLDRQLLMQALGNQLTLAQINSILSASKEAATLKPTAGKGGKNPDSSSHGMQLEKDVNRGLPLNDATVLPSSVGNDKNMTNGMCDVGAVGRNLMQPIRVLTQPPSSQPNNLNTPPTISNWSNPSTPNSAGEQTNTPPASTTDATPAMIANARLQLLHQKALQHQLATHPPLASLDKRFAGGSIRGRNPFLSRQRQLNEMELKHAAAALAAAANNERLYRANMVAEHAIDQGTFLKDFAGYPSPRSHFIEEFLPPEYAAGLPPPPPPHFGKLASHLAAAQAHGSPPFHEGLDYFPAAHFDPYLHAAAAAAAAATGRMPPPFFGPNDMFFDVLPPHFYGLPPFFAGFRPPRRTGPSNELHLRLEDCYDQFKNLERERKKTEAELARQNPGKKVSSANNIVIPRLPSNPSRVDRLVVDSLREHARVVTLIQKMEKLSGESLHANIHSAMETWMEGIRKVQARRKEEIINATNRHRNGGPRFQEEKDVLALAASIGELTSHIRRSRTAMWCALNTASSDVPQLRAQFRAVDAAAATTAAAAAMAAAVVPSPATSDAVTVTATSTEVTNSATTKSTDTSKLMVEDVAYGKAKLSSDGDDNNNSIKVKVDDKKQARVLKS